ncbi:FtsQ-type POTRA domain-containing protein [Microbacterium sp.]|uniref:FtsQ-type POTRA domain-containing protein n=1 Tax=Microbacterium sp. TaxID=51671 RepID=UPI002811E403|nr:FtsQ-type POTRA domain-containing protein [Microbacterium sp.]
MRRPPPLPTPAEQETAPQERRSRRRVDVEAITDGPRAQSDSDPRAQRDSGAGDDGSRPDEQVETPAPMTGRDVWRAARARRRALRAEIRRFTQRSRRRRIIWLSAAGALLLLVGGSVAAAYSPLFAVEKITVVGASALDAAAVEQALGDQIGTPLALVDASEVKAALLSFPLIETYALEAKPPHDLTVRIVERTAVGVVRSDAGYTLVDAAGVALATTTDQPAGQPLIEVQGGVDSAAFESLGLVIRALPADVRATVTGVRASTADDVTLTLASGLTVVWGSAEESVEKAIALSKTLLARPDAKTIDISSPHLAVVG